MHCRALLAAHITEMGCAEREEGGEYTTEKEEDSGEDEGEEGWGDAAAGSLGNGNGTSGTSTTKDDESLMEGADGTLGSAEDGG